MSTKTLILTVLSESEAKAVRSVFNLNDECCVADDKYPVFLCPDNGGSGKATLVACIVDKGNVDAVIATNYLLSKFCPDEAILVGTCAGRPDETKAGDVVVSRLGVHDYGQSTLVEGQAIRFDDTHHSRDLARRFAFQKSNKDLEVKWWPLILSNALKLDLKCLDGIQARLFDKAVASGSQIIDESKMKVLTDANASIFAADQDSAGFARSCEEKKVEWLVVRGVSDCGDRTERKEQATLAAIAAATLVKLYLESASEPGTCQSASKLDDKLSGTLGCTHIWTPTRGNEHQENDDRNKKKLSVIGESSGTTIRLLAQSGYSYLCPRGVFFEKVEAHLKQGGTFNVLISNLFAGDCALSGKEAYHRQAKYNMSLAGYYELKEEFNEQINLRTISFDPIATILITNAYCFYEPYTHILSEREKLLFVSFEMLFDKNAAEHGYLLMKKYFSHLYKNASELS
ncbi:MAG: hypothetical protein FWG42_03530 [Clostridiales bacterium]|nr:hypothetical protein [Clostridiales bacterium]